MRGHLWLDHLAFVRLSRRDRDVQNDAHFVINGSVLLYAGSSRRLRGVGGHCGLGIERKGRQSGKYKKVCTTPTSSSPVWFSLSTSPTCRSARLSQFTLARIARHQCAQPWPSQSSPASKPRPCA